MQNVSETPLKQVFESHQHGDCEGDFQENGKKDNSLGVHIELVVHTTFDVEGLYCKPES